jgi:hypothetical protein
LDKEVPSHESIDAPLTFAVSGVTTEEFDDMLESLRLQFETTDFSGLVNHSVERRVTDRDNIVRDSD